ncbi:MAG: helix-turn-helix domain-containing protein [Turicibacter sp.]|nr:helix-turn-helix domain-containing protein [Turicibacter sp.]
MKDESLKQHLMKIIGNRVKNLRKERQWSQEDLCGFAQNSISVRQLGEIERGKSMPSHETGYYLAEAFGISYAKLMETDSFSLPPRYLELKYELQRKPVYDAEERIRKKKMVFAEIYKDYFHVIPETEKLSIIFLEAIYEVRTEQKFSNAKEVLKTHFPSLNGKKCYTENELILIELYFNLYFFEKYQSSQFHRITLNLLEQAEEATGFESLLMIKLFIATLHLLEHYQEFDERFLKIIHSTNRLMQQNEDFQRKPVLDMAEGKYWLFVENDLDKAKAKAKYEAGAMMARIVSDEYLAGKIMEEWESDEKKYREMKQP